jgi:hypothetical protein
MSGTTPAVAAVTRSIVMILALVTRLSSVLISARIRGGVIFTALMGIMTVWLVRTYLSNQLMPYNIDEKGNRGRDSQKRHP